MKKIVFLLLLILVNYGLKAQLTALDDAKFYSFSVTKNSFKINIYIFNGIENTTEFDAGSDDAIWYTFDNPTTPVSSGTRKFYQPEDAKGYILDVNGQLTYIWVFDYQKYLPVFTSLIAEDAPQNQCESLNLLFDALIPDMTYKTPTGQSYKLDRNFTLKYNTLEWSDKWNTVERTVNVTSPKSTIVVDEAPLCDTYFTLKGDQWANELSLPPFEFTSKFYSAVAVGCHITTEAVTRSEKNEGERPDQLSAISGSSPLELFFKSNGNIPVPLYYKWTIYKGEELIVDRNDVDHRFTFVDAGLYKVKLITSNDYCSTADSMTVDISTSGISVPNVFTPNGDGQNDEFRVGYKSLVSFQCWVYNRWGRKVYYWNNPQKGWDGTINGVPASPGPYFYVIKALGADGITHNTQGDINLLRGKE